MCLTWGRELAGESVHRNCDLAGDCLGIRRADHSDERAGRPWRYNRAKYDSYECGIEPTPQPVGGGRFPVKYYITAMLFIVFDIEIVFLYPWAVAFDLMGTFALVEMILFIGASSSPTSTYCDEVDWIGIENARH